MMRTRCTSLTVAGTSPFPGVEVTQAQRQQQQHPHLQPQLTPQSTQQQRIVIEKPLRGVPATTTSLHQPGQSRGSPLLLLHNLPWPPAPQTESRLSGQQLPLQRTLHPQHRRN
ncbi:hypothetical protein FGIG_08072 [Fasciola gigantica]|uniref:Uncharacterized protein n=1 Tax=Fasciola gigantica TaxID=46835 RepID=A0A504YV19_FASGI|nr:hypothetical protein FGIG_08072 [Fasciola gigantica]